MLYQKQSCFADKERKVNTRDILREEGESIEPSTSVNLHKVLNIPSSISISILTSEILKVEYRLVVGNVMKTFSFKVVSEDMSVLLKHFDIKVEAI